MRPPIQPSDCSAKISRVACRQRYAPRKEVSQVKFSIFLNPQIPGSGYSGRGERQGQAAHRAGHRVVPEAAARGAGDRGPRRPDRVRRPDDDRAPLPLRRHGVLGQPADVPHRPGRQDRADPARAARPGAARLGPDPGGGGRGPARPVLQGAAAARRGPRLPEPLDERPRPALARRRRQVRRLGVRQPQLRRVRRGPEDHEDGVDPGDADATRPTCSTTRCPFPLRRHRGLAGRRVDARRSARPARSTTTEGAGGLRLPEAVPEPATRSCGSRSRSPTGRSSGPRRRTSCRGCSPRTPTTTPPRPSSTRRSRPSAAATTSWASTPASSRSSAWRTPREEAIDHLRQEHAQGLRRLLRPVRLPGGPAQEGGREARPDHARRRATSSA